MDSQVSVLAVLGPQSILRHYRGVQQVPKLRTQPRLRGYTRLRLPSGSFHSSPQEYRRGRGWRVRLDETEQRKGLGSHETTPITTPSPCSKRSSQLLGTSTWRRRRHSSRTESTRSNCRPFKRRAAPAPLAGEAGSGQDARQARRLRRSANKASKRSGGGPYGRRDTDGLDTSAVPEQHCELGQPDECGEPGNEPPSSRPANAEAADSGAEANILPEADEDFVLR